MKLFLGLFIFGLSSVGFATSNLEGRWVSVRGIETEFVEFNGGLTAHTRSYYANGAPADYFFEFRIPQDREVRAGEVYQGRLRSLDGLYGCVFDEPAQISLNSDGTLKVNFPLLTFHRETRSVRERDGYIYRRQIDWTRWGFVESVYRFPVDRWRVISSSCIVDQRNWITSTLSR